MTDTLLPCPFCGGDAQQTLSSSLVSCAYDECPAFLLAVYPDHWNTRATAQPAQVQGWQMVPVEPTGEMHKAANKADDAAYCGGSHHGADNEDIWYAMLAAAPKPPVCPKCFDITGCPSCEPKPPVQEPVVDDDYFPSGFTAEQMMQGDEVDVIGMIKAAAPRPSDDVAQLKAENERISGLVKHYSALNFQLVNEKADMRKQLDEAHRLLKAYGGGVRIIDAWLEANKP